MIVSFWQHNAEGDIDLVFCDLHIMHIIDRFEKTLKNTVFETADVTEEWHKTWHHIFNSEKCKIKSKKIFLVA